MAVALVGFLAAQVGFPMTVRPASESSMASAGHVRPCGCVVTDDCQKCCCSTKSPAAASCCQPKVVEKPDDCAACQTDKSTPQQDTSADAVHVEWVIASVMQHCHGVQTCWIALGAVLPPADHVHVQIDPRLLERVHCADAVAFTLSAAPTDPPPRIPSV